MALEILAQEKVWLDKAKYADAERVYYEKLSKVIDILNGTDVLTYNTSCAGCNIFN